jgi:holo-[acyl-carrier protein] synthase
MTDTPLTRRLHIGHDLQLISEMDERTELAEPGVMFTEAELCVTRGTRDHARCIAALFSVKEAFFKAIPLQSGWFWTELELDHEASGRPTLRFTGALAQLMRERAWTADVSLSHSGQYVSSFVVIHDAS